VHGVGRHLKRVARMDDAIRLPVDEELGFAFDNVSRFDARMRIGWTEKKYSHALSPRTGRASLQHRAVAVFQANRIKF
jgi:hypothetical protein